MLRIHAPGRINIIGEHTDYTGGLVMPAAIDKGIAFYAKRHNKATLRLHAVDLGEVYELPLPVTGKTGTLWVDYLAGIADQFQQLGNPIPGLEIVFGGDVPRGSGMSSSAALEGGMAVLLDAVVGASISRPELAQLCQRSSNNFIGIPSGIMDQFASLNGSANGPLMLNCANLEYTLVDATLPGYTWLLVNSMVSHELTGSEYPDRVRQCAQALELIRKRFPAVTHLSGATSSQLAATAADMPPIIYQRAQHVIHENERVRQAAEALQVGDAAEMGRLLNASHASLRDDYAVSCREVDFLQSQAVGLPAVAGARIMGGGFGGCTLNLVRTSDLEDVKAHLSSAYQERFDLLPEFYAVVISRGTSFI